MGGQRPARSRQAEIPAVGWSSDGKHAASLGGSRSHGAWDAAASPWWPVRPVCRVPPFMRVSKKLEQPLGKERSGLGTARFRIRRPGVGRKPLTEQQPELLAELERLVDPLTRGDPRSPLRWTCKSTPRLAAGASEAAVTR